MINNEITVPEFKAQLDRIESGLLAQKSVLWIIRIILTPVKAGTNLGFLPHNQF